MIKSVIAASLLCFTLGAGAAFAQTPAAAPNMKAAATPDKQALSKACSTQADTKGLHGKERKKFRSQCKKDGGKAN
jgi:hypothetical protein